jgi:dipeptidyl aminopeptidase/acylaminoacyl peptidase
MLRRFLAASLICTFWPQAAEHLTVDFIMQGHGLTGYAPKDARWSADGEHLYFDWKQAADPPHKEFDTWAVRKDGTGLRKLNEAEALMSPPFEAQWSPDRRRAAFERKGDVFLYEANQVRRITATEDRESGVALAAGKVAFTRANNLYLYDPASGVTEQVTDFRNSSTESAEDKKGTASQEYLKKQERELLEAVRIRAVQREQQRRKKLARGLVVVSLSGRQTPESIKMSPDGKWITALTGERNEKAQRPLIPSYVTESGYTQTNPARINVGDDQTQARLAIVNRTTGELSYADTGLKERSIELQPPLWSPDGSKAYLIGDSADNKDRWIFALDVEKASMRVLVHLHDDAWINYRASKHGWLPGSQRIYFVSERDGWMHLYTVDHGGGEARQLTSGAWEVRDVALSWDQKKFHITSCEAHPGEEHLYEMGFDGGGRKALTRRPGIHSAVVSPDGKSLADIYDYVNQPPELYLDGKPVTSSPTDAFRAHIWLDAPIVSIPSRDGKAIPARIYKSANFATSGPAVIFVHGAGYLQNVHKGWSSNYFREYLFHNLLVERGYLVLDIDYRASAGYGRDWRTAIYRHMGGKDLDDHVDAARWAVREHGVDPKRIGIYGGSYGGFITLMAMFTQPDVFRAGAALRPVTDWAHYNHGYTSNILNTPQKDEEAFRKSSPIFHAAGLKGALLICHGMVDDNVHYQDSVRLAQRLIELGKENWEFASYPVESHGFVQPSSWADEYKRILKLFEQHLR